MGVSSSRPALCTTSARRLPSARSTSAMSGATPGAYTPTRLNGVAAGFSSGPSRLNAVRTRSALRVGLTAASAGLKRDANMKPRPTSRRQRPTPAGPRSAATPSACGRARV